MSTIFSMKLLLDTFLFFLIFCLSTFFFYLTLNLKINFLILKLQSKIVSLKTLIGLLDQKILILDKQLKYAILEEVNTNIIIAGIILISVGIAIAILLFFFSGGSGSNTPSTSDSFSSKSSEDSFSRSSSKNDLTATSAANSNVGISTNINNNSVSSITEDTVIQTNTQMLDLEPLNTSLKGTFDQIASMLYPNVVTWDVISNEHPFEQSPTVKVGSVLNAWLSNLKKSYASLEEGKNYIETLKDIEFTLDSIDLNLPPLIDQVNRFLVQTDLNQFAYNAKFDYVLEARDSAFELTQILLEHESILNQMLPGNIIVPEWFGVIIGFYSMLNVVSNLVANDINNYLVNVSNLLETSDFSDSDLSLRNILVKKIDAIFRYVFRFTTNTGSRIGGGFFLSVMEEGIDLEEQNSSHVFRNLLKIVLKYRECFSVDPSNIFLFL